MAACFVGGGVVRLQFSSITALKFPLFSVFSYDRECSSSPQPGVREKVLGICDWQFVSLYLYFHPFGLVVNRL